MVRFRNTLRLGMIILALCLFLPGADAWGWMLPGHILGPSSGREGSTYWDKEGDMVRKYVHMIQTYNLYKSTYKPSKEEFVHFRKLVVWPADDEFTKYCYEVFPPNVNPAVLPTECSNPCKDDEVYTRVEKMFQKMAQ